MTKKEKQQLAGIGLIILIIVGVLIYYFHDRFLPRPEGAVEDFSVSARPEAAVRIDAGILQRSDYIGLKYFGPIDIVPTPITRKPAVAVPSETGAGAAAGGGTGAAAAAAPPPAEAGTPPETVPANP